MDQQNNTPTPQASAPEEKPQTSTPISEDDGKLCAVLAYLLIGIIWYFVDEKMKNKEFVKFHVKQSLVLLIVSVGLQIIGTALPIISWIIILPLAYLLTLILTIIGIVSATAGKMKELPIIGGYAKKFTF